MQRRAGKRRVVPGQPQSKSKLNAGEVRCRYLLRQPREKGAARELALREKELALKQLDLELAEQELDLKGSVRSERGDRGVGFSPSGRSAHGTVVFTLCPGLV